MQKHSLYTTHKENNFKPEVKLFLKLKKNIEPQQNIIKSLCNNSSSRITQHKLFFHPNKKIII